MRMPYWIDTLRTKWYAYKFRGYPGILIIAALIFVVCPFLYLCLCNQDYLLNQYHSFLVKWGLEEAPVIPKREPYVEPVQDQSFTTKEIIIISAVIIGTVLVCGALCGGVIFIF